MSYTPWHYVRMNDAITILLGAVLPILMVLWQIVRCALIIRRMRPADKSRREPNKRMMNVTLYT